MPPAWKDSLAIGLSDDAFRCYCTVRRCEGETSQHLDVVDLYRVFKRALVAVPESAPPLDQLGKRVPPLIYLALTLLLSTVVLLLLKVVCIVHCIWEDQDNLPLPRRAMRALLQNWLPSTCRELVIDTVMYLWPECFDRSEVWLAPIRVTNLIDEVDDGTPLMARLANVCSRETTLRIAKSFNLTVDAYSPHSPNVTKVVRYFFALGNSPLQEAIGLLVEGWWYQREGNVCHEFCALEDLELLYDKCGSQVHAVQKAFRPHVLKPWVCEMSKKNEASAQAALALPKKASGV